MKKDETGKEGEMNEHGTETGFSCVLDARPAKEIVSRVAIHHCILHFTRVRVLYIIGKTFHGIQQI